VDGSSGGHCEGKRQHPQPRELLWTEGAVGTARARGSALSRGNFCGRKERWARRGHAAAPSVGALCYKAQPLTQMSTRNLLECKARSARKAGDLTAICELIAQTVWDPRHPTASVSLSTGGHVAQKHRSTEAGVSCWLRPPDVSEC
jgi:hypothetical protein